ncbi:uncharacterized protein LOC108949521 [Ciona intestinalis]
MVGKVLLILLAAHILKMATGQEATPEPCGGELVVGEFTLIKNPGYPNENNQQGKYPNNADCVWTYEGNEDSLVVFKFWDLVIELGDGGSNSTCDYDYLEIDIESLGPTKYCGYSKPEEAIMGFGSLTIHFASDDSVNYRGFQASYSINEDYNPCEPDPCINGDCGRSEDRVRRVCECFPGAEGEVCEIDINECESDPCQNGGSCTQSSDLDLYTCQCAISFNGDNCENEMDSPCVSNPCQNDATCSMIPPFNYVCDCAQHYKGINCEIADFPPCLSSPCNSGGTCNDIANDVTEDDVTISDYNGYTCACTRKYRGVHCETETGCMNPGIPYVEENKKFDEGSTVEFSCVEGFILVGKANTTCTIDGSWSNQMPECINNSTSTEDTDDSMSSWTAAMIGLGVALAIKVVLFTLWMVYRGPWVKMDDDPEIPDNDTFKQHVQSVSSYISDDVFERERPGSLRSYGTSY